jgi:hypothetical protein
MSVVSGFCMVISTCNPSKTHTTAGALLCVTHPAVSIGVKDVTIPEETNQLRTENSRNWWIDEIPTSSLPNALFTSQKCFRVPVSRMLLDRNDIDVCLCQAAESTGYTYYFFHLPIVVSPLLSLLFFAAAWLSRRAMHIMSVCEETDCEICRSHLTEDRCLLHCLLLEVCTMYFPA